MNEPKRIQRKRSKGWKAPLDENGLLPINVARPSIFGNPFPVAYYGQEEAVECYERWLDGEDLADIPGTEPQRRAEVLRRLPELKGRNLMCWCANEPCHAMILLKRANQEPTQ